MIFRTVTHPMRCRPGPAIDRGADAATIDRLAVNPPNHLERCRTELLRACSFHTVRAASRRAGKAALFRARAHPRRSWRRREDAKKDLLGCNRDVSGACCNTLLQAWVAYPSRLRGLAVGIRETPATARPRTATRNSVRSPTIPIYLIAAVPHAPSVKFGGWLSSLHRGEPVDGQRECERLLAADRSGAVDE